MIKKHNLMMDIVTIFNYPNDDIYNEMFRVWLFQAIRCKFSTQGIENIIILSKGISLTCEKLLDCLGFPFIHVKKGSQYNLHNPPEERWHHNVGYKLYNLTLLQSPYIFIDADAIFVKYDLSCLIDASHDKPLIGVNHQTIPQHTDRFRISFINTGFLVVSDPSFLKFDKLLNTDITVRIPGTDQLLIYNYCINQKYDYTHPDVPLGWNSCGGYKQKINNKIMTHGIVEYHPVFVLHYWDVFKPWITPCNIYKSLSHSSRLFTLCLSKMKFESIKEAFTYFFSVKQDAVSLSADEMSLLSKLRPT